MKGTNVASRGRRAPRRGSDWECAQAGAILLQDTCVADWLVLPSTIRDFYTDPTLMATRWFAYVLSGGTAVTNLSALAIGIIAWDSPDDTVPANFPCPLDNCDLDWITRFVAGYPNGTADFTGTQLVLDNTHLSNARRKLGNQKGILVSFETRDLPFTSRFTMDARMLLKDS